MPKVPKSLTRYALLIVLTFLLSNFGYSANAPTFSIVVKPLVEHGKVTTLDIRQTLTGDLPLNEAPLVFQAPLSMFGVKSVAGRIEGLRVTDAKGNVALTVKDDTRQVGPVFGTRRWQAARKTVAPVRLHYRIATQPTGEGGPPYGMKPSGAGVAGRGIGFLVLPENTTSRTTRFEWDLSQLPANSRGVITAGDDSTVVPGPPSEMATQWLLAGPARVFDSTRSPGFHVYLLGEQPFNPVKMITWADRGYATLAASLKYLGTPEYRLFFRSLDVPSYATGTGREAGGGALMTVGNTLGTQSLDEVKTTVFHEMAHQWVGDLSGAGAWFVEGLTTYLSGVLPCQSGMAEPDFCAVGVNNHAESYYGATARNWSLARIDEVGSKNEDVRRVPYGRGMLYFALLNSQLLEKSRGKHGVLDALAPMFVARAKGVRLDETEWEAMLLRELGQTAVTDFRAYVTEGEKTILPPSEAFGPCLQRVSKRMKMDRVGAEVDGYAWQPIAGCRPRFTRARIRLRSPAPAPAPGPAG